MRSAVVVLATLLASSTSHADPGEAREALQHLDRGIAAYRLGDYEGAEKELSQAHDLAPERPNPYRWLALTEDKLGDCAHAVEHAEAFLSRVPATDARVPEIVALRENCVAQAKTGPGSGSSTIDVVTPLPPPVHETPITHRWWFWTAAGAIVVTGAGITAYALTRSSSGPAMLPGVHCMPTGCSP